MGFRGRRNLELTDSCSGYGFSDLSRSCGILSLGWVLAMWIMHVEPLAYGILPRGWVLAMRIMGTDNARAPRWAPKIVVDAKQ